MAIPTLQEYFDLNKPTYDAAILSVAQQTQPRFSGRIPAIDLATGEHYIDGVGVLNAYKDNDINSIPKYQDASMFRRKVTTNKFYINVKLDRRSMLQNMMNGTLENMLKTAAVSAFNREYDKVALAAASATVYYGNAGGSTISAANDGVATIAATAGWTYDIFRSIISSLAAKEVGLEAGEKITLAVSEQEQSQWLDQVEFIQDYYAAKLPGTRNFAGFSSIMGMDTATFGSNPDGYDAMLAVAAGVRTNILVAGDGLMFARFNGGLSVELIDLKETTNDSVAIRCSAEVGAVRMFGNKVKLITSTVA